MGKIGPYTIKSVILKTNHLRYFSKILCKYTLLKSDNLTFCLFFFFAIYKNVKRNNRKLWRYN